MKLSPKVRIEDRGWSYFQSVPCAEIPKTTVNSEREQALLDRRRRQCLDKYRAFAPDSSIR